MRRGLRAPFARTEATHQHKRGRVAPFAGLEIAAHLPLPLPLGVIRLHSRAVQVSTGPGNLDTVDEVAIAYSDDPSKRAVLIAAALGWSRMSSSPLRFTRHCFAESCGWRSR